MKTKFHKLEKPLTTPPIIWCSVLDERYGLEVERLEPYKGQLRIYDLDKENELIFERLVGIAFDAKSGVDASDSTEWHQTACDFIDFKYGDK